VSRRGSGPWKAQDCPKFFQPPFPDTRSIGLCLPGHFHPGASLYDQGGGVGETPSTGNSRSPPAAVYSLTESPLCELLDCNTLKISDLHQLLVVVCRHFSPDRFARARRVTRRSATAAPAPPVPDT